ncbi:MAG: type VII secretion integral membrane protein EccD [Microbacterium sp.]|uniref:type VII secretion integral membrane protein EccD n=1 Tax=Microbacterium sp. TaxID=51671 RepID=UPI002637099B|nr:type VII secretion integral membrane protein EccD [Microbacterium sp.]MCX6502529.1 type VII secretion integral membrane protein EccD [Microbacterium sp.]
MAQTITAPRSLLRISVQSEGRRLDIGVPAQVPLIEFMPGFARSLGVLDPTMTSNGYALLTADGKTLDISQGAAAQGVEDGDVLTLARGGLVTQPRVYDDIVEAVIDATAEQTRPWSPQDNARTALAASLTLLGICAILLLAVGPGLGLGSLIAAGGAVVLLVVAAVVSRLGQGEAGHGLGIAAAVFSGLAGYLATPPGASLWGFPLAMAGISALVCAGIAMALMPERGEIQLVPLVVAGTLAISSGIAVLMPGGEAAVYALTVAVVGTLGGALPWLVLSSTRIRVISPQSDAEMFADPVPIDAEDVRRRAARGRRMLVCLRLAAGLVLLAAVPLVAASGPVGAALCLLASLAMMFPSRQAYSRASVLAVMGVGTVGLAATGITVALTQPGLRTALLVVVAVATVIVVTLTLLSPKARMRLTRLADTAELVILALLLPLGAIAAGWA